MIKGIFPTFFACCFVLTSHQVAAQNSIQLFGPVNVRPSASETSQTNPAFFNSNTLNLSCAATPVVAVLSSTANPAPASSTGFVLVDNSLNVTVTTANGSTGPFNVCKGGVESPTQNCFTTTYQTPAGAGKLNGVNPDTLLPGGGVPPIDISALLSQGSQQVKFDLEDFGGFLANSTLYLNTNCTSEGVSAPATISGNTISSTNPTQDQLKQDFPFNPVAGNEINFEYDLTSAQSAGTLAINSNGVIPSVGDSAIDPAQFQPNWVQHTSFATSSCLVHSGETLPGRAAGCKLYTLTCTVGTGSDASGINCPTSSEANETIRDIFDGPAFALQDISTVINGVPFTFHEGVGFLMASEPWTGGPCQFASGSGFENETCPQNLLSTFSGPGLFNSSAITTHPNSTFITVAGIPEDLTSVTVAGMKAGNWVNTSTPSVTFASQPPILSNSSLPNAANFVPSPIQSITYGISAADNVPSPPQPIAGDATLQNSAGCPSATDPTNPPATPFGPDPVTLDDLADGQYAIHYFATDCAGTEELSFVKDGSGSWSTHFYTFPINVDTVVPQVASGPTLSPAPPYFQGETVTATFSCTDTLSGVVQCGGKSFPAGTLNTGSVTATVNTATPGSNTFTIPAVDAAGNQNSASVNYSVNAVDSQIQLTLSPTTVTYPLGTNLQVVVSKINSHVPTGSIQIQENGVTLTKLTLGGGGAAYFYLKGLSAGMHTLTAVYSGDGFNPGGISAPVTLNVLPVPVALALACWNTPYAYGANFQCVVTASSNAGAPLGSITYAYDKNASATLPLSSGKATIVITKPPVGMHSIVVSYPAQTNYAASGPQVENFTVSPAPVIIKLTPSTWYLTGGTLTLTASVQSSSAGPPNATGQITFTNGATVLATVPVNSAGSASTNVAASALANGNQTITATYSAGLNYANGSTSITIQVAR